MSTSAPPPAGDRKRALLVALGAATFMVGLDGRIVAPLLPSIAAEFHCSLAVASYTVSFYLLPYGLCQLGYGPLADRFGKVRVAAYAMLAFSAGTAACGAFSSLAALLTLRALTGAAAAALIPLTIAHIGDTVPYAKRQAALGMLMASWGAAQGLSTSAGGIMAQVMSWRSIFPVIGGLSGVVALWLLSEARHVARLPFRASTGSYRQALRSRLTPILGLVFVEGALFMGCFPFVSGLLEARFHSRPLEIGLVLGAAGLSQVLIAKLLPWILARWREEQLVAAGSCLMAAAYLGCAVAPSAGWVAVSCAALGAGFSSCHSTLQARATEAFPSSRGRSLALFAFSLFVGGGVGSFAMAALAQAAGFERSFGLASLLLLAFAYAATRSVARPRLDFTSGPQGSLPGAPIDPS